MGKRKIVSEEESHNMVMPEGTDVIGLVTKMLGGDRLLAKCSDGKVRMCRIRGKMKKRVWIRMNDIILVTPWEVESDKKGDVIWRYTQSQAKWLEKKGYTIGKVEG